MESRWDFPVFLKNRNVLNNPLESDSPLSLPVIEVPRQSKMYIIQLSCTEDGWRACERSICMSCLSVFSLPSVEPTCVVHSYSCSPELASRRETIQKKQWAAGDTIRESTGKCHFYSCSPSSRVYGMLGEVEVSSKWLCAWGPSLRNPLLPLSFVSALGGRE